MNSWWSRNERWFRRGAITAILLVFGGYALWGIAAPFAWGHYGYHAGFHGAAARNLVRHGTFTPTPHIGWEAPPEEARYLHHPIIFYQYLVPFQAVFGEGEWVIRVVPVLFTLGIILLVLAVGRRFWGPWGGICAAAVFVLLPHNLVFCHLLDHETPGILYTLLGVFGLLAFLEEAKLRWACACLAGFALAGLTDWPPYFIAFAAAWAASGWLLAASFFPHRPHRVGLFAAGIGGLLIAFHHVFTQVFHWPEWQVSVVAFSLFVGALLAAGSAPTTPATEYQLTTRWGAHSGLGAFRRVMLLRWGLVAGLTLVLVFTLWFHFKYTEWVGMRDDLSKAFSVRSGQIDFYPYLKKYVVNVRYTLSDPVVLACSLWALSLPLRLALGRPLLRAVLPLAFFTGQLFYNIKFPGAADVHIYRTYFFVIFACFATVDVFWELGALLGWAFSRVPEPRFSRLAPHLAAGLVGALLFGLLIWEAKAALPVAQEGRRRSGTLRFFAPYRHQLDKQRFFAEVKRRTSPRTIVLYLAGLHPRYEAKWYLDRDNYRVFSVPPSKKAAVRAARRVRRRLGQSQTGFENRPIVLIASAWSGRHGPALHRLLPQFRVSRIGDWFLVHYDSEVPNYRSYRLVRERYRSWLSRYLRGPYERHFFVRDLWQEWRTVTRYGLPPGGRPRLPRPPRAGANAYDWAAWQNASVMAKAHRDARKALAHLRSMLGRPKTTRLGAELTLVGYRAGRNIVDLYIRASRSHTPRCRLRLDAVPAQGRRRPGRPIHLGHEVRHWLEGIVYVISYKHHLRRGVWRIELQPCGGDAGRKDNGKAAAETKIDLGALKI